MKFKRMEFDENLHTAELSYEYEEESMIYLINASYANASWGVDVEDEIVNIEERILNGCRIEIKEYKTPKTNTKRYSARFKYNGLEYFLIGTMPGDDFNNIVNNLFFSK